MQPDDQAAAALRDIADVSRETVERLRILVGLVGKWQRAENLVAPDTLPAVWRRHVADSAQLLPLAPHARRWVDLGSGGGFPGLVIAAFMAEAADGHVVLVESNQRKCAFLRRAIAEASLPATVRNERIEAFATSWDGKADVITARALAPLPRLLGLCAPLLREGRTALFPKGRDFQGEIDDAAQSWAFDLVLHKSRIDEAGVILEIPGPIRRLNATGQRT